MKAAFQLDKRSKKDEKPLILTVSVEGSPVKSHTGIYVSLKDWNQKTYEISGNSNYAIDKRDQLYTIRKLIEIDIPRKYNGPISKQELKNELDAFFNKGEAKTKADESLLTFFFDKYIEMNSNMAYNTLRMYGTIKNNLLEFIEKSKMSQNTGRLKDKAYSLNFFSAYLKFLFEEKNYLNPSAETDFKKINRVVNYHDLEIKTHKSKLFNSFSNKVNYQQTKSVLITPEEAESIWRYQAKHKNEFEAQMCYLFAYETGLEVSALFGVSEDNVREVTMMQDGEAVKFNVMDVITKKHRDSNMRTIYLTPRAKEILERCQGPYSVKDRDQKTGTDIWYENCALPVNLNMLNRYIKIVCNNTAKEERKKAIAAGNNNFTSTLEEAVTYIKYSGVEKIVTEEPKWKRITMHTARHSFVNNAEALGLNVTEAGKLVGHASHKTTEKHYQRKNIEVPLFKLHKAKTA